MTAGLVAVLAALACGRIGYEPAPLLGADGPAGPADARDGAPSPADAGPPEPGGLDGGGPDPGGTDGTVDVVPPPPVDGPPDTRDAEAPRDLAPEVAPADVAPVDMRPDTTPPPPDAPAACPVLPADLVADFEDGTLVLSRVGDRGGQTFRTLHGGTVTNVANALCGQRAMQAQAPPTPIISVLVQGPFMTDAPDGQTRYLDARGYRGIRLSLRASVNTAVRIKVPNRETIAGGNDHFLYSVTATTSWATWSLNWSEFRQSGASGTTQYPSLDPSRLFGIELSASLPPGALLWVDQISFLR